MTHQGARYEQPTYADAGFPLVFHQDQMTATRRSVHTNWHEGIELLYCREGCGRVLLGAEAAEFASGDLVIVNSTVLHTLHLVRDPCRYHCMIVEPSLLAAHGIDTRDVLFASIVRDAAVCAHFDGLCDSFAAGGSLLRAKVLVHVLQLFIHLVQAHTLPGPPQGRDGDSRSQRVIVEAISYIRDHLAGPISIDQVSRHVGMSKYYFCRQFAAYTGTTVNRHINALKCELARRLMRENGFNVSEAAQHLGFQNLSYFSKLYKKHTGELPSGECAAGAARAKARTKRAGEP